MLKVISRLFLIYLSVLYFNACVTSKIIKSPDDSGYLHLINQLELLVNDPNLSSAQIGLYIENLSSGEILYQKNPNKRFIPASNMKLYTTAAALSKLGKDYKFQTEFWYDGIIEDSVLKGNLIIKGEGDPSISGKFNNGDVLALFKSWRDSLLNMGIKSVQGDIIGDESYFQGDKLGNSWSWDDETYWYSAQINALSFNDNCIGLTITAGDSVGSSVVVEKDPDSDYSIIHNTAITIHQDSSTAISILRDRAKNIIRISGMLAKANDTIRTSVTVEAPGEYFLKHFRAVLDTSSIDLSGKCLISDSGLPYDRMKKLFIHYSPDMTQLIRVVNKGSHNFYADQIFKSLGAELKNKGTWEDGSDAVKEWLASIGTAIDELSIFDGSGLSRVNLLTPVATANLLRYMYHNSNFLPFYESLPVAGVDGSLNNRMRGTSAEGNVRAKTGFVRHARSLSGYVHDSKDTPYLFVMMVNHYSVPTRYVNQFQDRICVLLSNF